MKWRGPEALRSIAVNLGLGHPLMLRPIQLQSELHVIKYIYFLLFMREQTSVGLYIRHPERILHCTLSFNPHNNSSGHNHPHFTDEEPEVQINLPKIYS